MNISRLILGATLLCTLPALAQPDAKATLPNGLPYPVVFPDAAVKMLQKEKPISLHLHDVTLLDALAELEKQTGVTLDVTYGGYPAVLANKLSLDLETRSFNQAFRAIIEEAGAKANVQRFGDDGEWHIAFDEDPPDAPVSGKVPFQFRFREIRSSLTKTLTAGKPPERRQDHTLSVGLLTDFDPRIPIIKSGIPHITRAEDDKGHALSLDERFSLRLESGLKPSVDLYFKAPESAGRSLTHLDGSVIYVVATKYEKWEVADVLTTKDVSHDFVGKEKTLRATIKSVQQVGNQLQMEWEVNTLNQLNKADDSLLSYDQLREGIHIQDANGREFTAGSSDANWSPSKITGHASFHLARQDRRQVIIKDGQVTSRPADTKPEITGPITFTINVPTEFVQTEVPFSFSNIPLP